ncbi:two-component sensor histidine kinase [Amycolatopsis sp. WAC 01375]|uniref:sensor histidine kinase n=1 Tax=unclassified Amycolatopsis TaxID=2618356 RepID=UPI000F7ACE5E|nr:MULTISPECIES: histidine kinase [unclassified Amycolatopsis]RSM84097.1 two-component sensor histidine kinase [Amycolatopsis sp. WAC 01375]RSN37933.1 two-component sensor histidine kinase [Amycolatopsis sp. WAC 01416]
MAGDSSIAVILLLTDLLLYVAAAETPEVQSMPPWYVAVPLDIAMVAPLVFRRKATLWSAYLVLLVGIPHGALELGAASAFAVMISIYSVLVYVGRKQGLLYLLATLVTSGLQLWADPPEDVWVLAIIGIFSSALCWTLGEFAGARRAYHEEVEARLHLLETERDQATRIAVGEERGRIARELHDVVAHAVSVMVVQADGASYAVDGNPEMAKRALQTISETGRGALAELRRLLDVLRSDGDDEPRVPQPDASALTDLADRIRQAGVPVTLAIGSDALAGLPAGVSLGVYRIVQESLTNTLKHAGQGAQAEVLVRREADVIDVRITDDGAGRAKQLVPAATKTGSHGAPSGPRRLTVPGGNGLIGMKERANVFGGTLEVGPAPGGGWQVHARLPVRLAT